MANIEKPTEIPEEIFKENHEEITKENPKEITIKVPEEVQNIIGTLEENGYEAFIVGGCVRDAVLGKEPEDWDICTSALPEQTNKCFKEQHIIETGLKHGTVTIVVDHKPFEITTYRIDGSYSDNRHPDSVEFVNDLKEDLSRRDFTINAMAYNPDRGVVDFFDSISDIKDHIIRCVGDADKRFQEDALRIMRALRFAAVLGFDMEEKTSAAIFRNKELLKNIAAERISSEINKLIVGQNIGDLLLNYTSVIKVIIPEISEMIGFEQNNPYHYLDVWRHTIESVVNAPADKVLRLTMLFHDIAKPKCYTVNDSVGHFYGHPQVSADMTKQILKRLKYDKDTVKTVTQLIFYHDTDIQPKRKHIRRWLNRIGEERFRRLIEVMKADAMAQSERSRMEKINELEKVVPVLDEIIKQQLCFSLRDLDVNGRDLIAAGVTEGAEIGKTLNRLLEMVIDELLENEKDKLIAAAKELI